MESSQLISVVVGEVGRLNDLCNWVVMRTRADGTMRRFHTGVSQRVSSTSLRVMRLIHMVGSHLATMMTEFRCVRQVGFT